MSAVRHEHDLLADCDVPADAYWGVHTARARENFPITGTTIAAYPHLIEALAAEKAVEFHDVLEMSRTQLQDAVPTTLGQEFGTYAVMLGEDRERLTEAAALLHEITLGATAIGTGLNAAPGYAEAACAHLGEITGIGYAAATEIAKEALASGRGVVELVVERGLIPADELEALLAPYRLSRPHR